MNGQSVIMDPNIIGVIEAVKTIATPICTLIMGWLGIKYGYRQIFTQRKIDRIEKQVKEFYAPMIGHLKLIRALSSVRYEVDKVEKDDDESQKNTEYNNNLLENELIPHYREMQRIYTENYMLAEETTKEYYEKFIKFINIWDRFYKGNRLRNMEHSEEELKPFYKNLEEEYRKLEKKVKRMQ